MDTTPTPTDIDAAMRRLARDVDAAYNESDPARVAGCWTEDGLNVDPFGDRSEGRAAIEDDLRAGLEGFLKDSRHELAIGHITSIDERTAVADGTATISGIVGFDGATMEPQASDFSMICVLRDDGWRIAQMRAYRFLSKQN